MNDFIPGAHKKQTDRWEDDVNFPASQSMHSVDEKLALYFPAGQAEHVLAAESLAKKPSKKILVQWIQYINLPGEHEKQADNPEILAKKPLKQVWHELAPKTSE